MYQNRPDLLSDGVEDGEKPNILKTIAILRPQKSQFLPRQCQEIDSLVKYFTGEPIDGPIMLKARVVLPAPVSPITARSLLCLRLG